MKRSSKPLCALHQAVIPALAAVIIGGAVTSAPASIETGMISADSALLMQDMRQTTGVFSGVKVNKGTATLMHNDDKCMLTWSKDFVIPDAPAPHWQVVDSDGNVYLLQRLKIKDDKLNRTIEVPAYVRDIAKVQIWCAWAETLLGEASFATPVKCH